jgi:beta-glucosidase
VADIDKLIAELTLEEKVSLCHGSDFMSTRKIERLGIPRMWVTDGPHGARGRGWGTTSTAAIPCGTALGATWDTDLLYAIGELLGRQVLSKGANILLGPTMNIHREPLAGRNFECYSEEPYLSARIAVAEVDGLQSSGKVGACIKHYVANDQEFERMTISAEVDERTLREVYLLPFEACVVESKAWSIMTAYNRLNQTYCAEHAWLLEDVLRGEWGFDGYVISDWWGAKSTVASANAGLDLEMPGPGVWFGEGLLQAVKDGQVSEATIDAKVRRLLSTMETAGRFDAPEDTTETALDTPGDRATIRRCAAESIVLLKNDGALPVSAGRSVAVIGPNADVARFGGGGSSEVLPHYLVTPLDAIRQAADGPVTFARGSVPYTMLPAIDPRLMTGFDVEFFAGLEVEGDVLATQHIDRASHRWIQNVPVPQGTDRFSARLTTTFTPDEDGDWTFGLVAAGRARLIVDGELVIDNWTEFEHSPVFFGMGSKEKTGVVAMQAGTPRSLVVEYRAATTFAAGVHVGAIRPMGSDRIAEAVATAKDADVAVVIVGLDPESETEGRDRESMSLTGDQDELIRAVAAANPNTVVVVQAGSIVSLDWAGDVNAICYAWYGGQECGNAIADVLFGKTNPCGKLPQTIPMRYEDNPAFGNYPTSGDAGAVRYEEGIFVGHRHYDAKQIEPRYPFGHGLSYTSFDYGTLEIERDGDDVVAFIDVTNTGDVAGKEVVQLYVTDVESSVPRPPKELKGFEKIALEPGQTTNVRFTLGPRAFQYWGEDGQGRAGWVLEPGAFELQVGSSSRDLRATVTITL